MIIEKARELGIALSESEEFTAMNEAKLAMERDEALMEKLAAFNEKQSRIMEMMSEEEVSQAEISRLSAEMETLRTSLIEDETFVRMLETQGAFQALMKRVNRAIGVCIGADLEQEENGGCGGDCAGCRGCH
ncbi:MAG TPA: YlbF family regulator [Clostridia bacterium]|jgi:cell fate (sporulation/competence/biofilm development) regulator YlbF (YheA/YmcA/DUF963 family)|nr:MAG: hypothetical protein BWY35_01767 [Firmicutes bacterium ADurb.Bin248]HOG01890.1 YlbF family regulator [Clostridia bacterium]HOS18423.1 YlbF family regulator [Clostridia bacterium]HPK15006.1 YlbF family regulator [Clostridia bacterium]